MDEQPKPDPEASQEKRGVAMARGMALTDTGLQLRTFEDALAFGKAMIESGMVPKGFTKSSQVVWAVQRGREMGLPITASLEAFYMSPAGKPTLYSQSAMGIVLASGLLEDHRMEVTGSGDALTATFHYKRKGCPWAAESFSLADARTAMLVKPDSNWQKYPKRMVKARARAFGLKDGFPDVFLGVRIEGDGGEDAAGSEITILPDDPSAETPRVSPTVDPLLEKLDIHDAEIATSAPAESVELPAQPQCECPESAWRTVDGNVVCGLCGQTIGPA